MKHEFDFGELALVVSSQGMCDRSTFRRTHKIGDIVFQKLFTGKKKFGRGLDGNNPACRYRKNELQSSVISLPRAFCGLFGISNFQCKTSN